MIAFVVCLCSDPCSEKSFNCVGIAVDPFRVCFHTAARIVRKNIACISAYFELGIAVNIIIELRTDQPVIRFAFLDGFDTVVLVFRIVPFDIFKRIVAVLRIAVPYTGMIMSTRESPQTRRECLEIGITQISGGSRTSVGGYVEEERPEDTAQFDVDDRRSLGEVVDWLIDLGYVPSFCTACYREGRTGDRFMSLLKSGQIANCCQPNALMTLKEFLMDYSSDETHKKGDKIIAERLAMIPNEKVRKLTEEHLKDIEEGKRDFRF